MDRSDGPAPESGLFRPLEPAPVWPRPRTGPDRFGLWLIVGGSAIVIGSLLRWSIYWLDGFPYYHWHGKWGLRLGIPLATLLLGGLIVTLGVLLLRGGSPTGARWQRRSLWLCSGLVLVLLVRFAFTFGDEVQKWWFDFNMGTYINLTIFTKAQAESMFSSLGLAKDLHKSLSLGFWLTGAGATVVLVGLGVRMLRSRRRANQGLAVG